MNTTKYITLSGHAIDITGQRFGRLVALGPIGQGESGDVFWRCRCDCGNTANVVGGSLRKGVTRSCGCLAREGVTKRNRKHGMRWSPEYRVWQGMKARCTNPNDHSWDNYGGRGIKVCRRWMESFEAFYEDMGPRPSPDHSIDRIDNDGDYMPDNCRWVDLETQANNKRSNRMITHDGRTQTVAQWTKEIGVKEHTIRNRLKAGWSVHDALTTATTS